MHIQQQKTCKNMQAKYYCKACDYKCSKKFLWDQHLSTRKHKSATQATNPQHKNMPLHGNNPGLVECLHICSVCSKSYKSRSGLWRHQKKCIEKEDAKVEKLENMIVSKTETAPDDMKILVKEMMEHMKTQAAQLRDQTKIINEMIPRIGSNNNNRFNINLFLNEQCKDALNMSDFLESLKIQLSDINYIRDNGLMDGISSVFINGLKQLDTYKRPIHCTDVKRETLYIKENNEWEKDGSKEKVKTAIGDLAQKHRIAISDWEKSNPNWKDSENGREEYIQLVQSLMSDVQDDTSENRIIKNIAKNTLIDDTVKN
tara:strand:+ start:1295 stop:2239 length:945 start_codon:yes stop_codon:yes gene_type:complete